MIRVGLRAFPKMSIELHPRPPLAMTHGKARPRVREEEEIRESEAAAAFMK